MIGRTIGPYQIVALLGEGGMGKVWRAHHAALRRDDALKVLPDAFASDPDRLARFQREAQVLASLNHPNIAHVYGLEQSEGVQALVMELVEGPPLADRIARGPIPVDEALPIAKQIAEALEAAHEQGIIHRDLKPANIKVRPDGTVKVLDFGLAKLIGPAEAGHYVRDATASPTITSPAMMTGLGVLLGTAAYMSPEQARGKVVDKRTDIWAFGCVLYEMLAGRRAFGGEEVADTLAFVLSREPDWLALPATAPVSIRKLLHRCLEKDRRRRLADIADARFELDEAPADEPAPPVARRTLSRAGIAWFAAGVCLTAALGLVAAMYLRSEPAEAPTMRFVVSPPDGWSLASGSRFGGVATSPLAVSPNGRFIALLARNAEGRDRLWVRSLDTLAARELPGTNGAIGPFWSPDSEWIAFFAEGRLQKIAIAGGAPITVCETPTFNAGSWGPDGTILFALGPGTGVRPIRQVSALGGVASDATVVADGEANHVRPVFHPDGRHFFFRVLGGANAGYYVTALGSPERTRLFGSEVGNVVFAGDHLLFLRDTSLVAQQFDVRQLRLTGEAVPVAEQIARFGGGAGVGTFSASSSVLAYQAAIGGGSRLTWFARDGMPMEAVSDPANYSDLSLSPDGRRALVSVPEANRLGGQRDIWLVDLTRGLRTRFTFDASDELQSVWSPDGRRVIFDSLRKSGRDLYQKNSNLTGVEGLLQADAFSKHPESVSPDGRLLLYSTGPLGQPPDIWILPLTEEARPRAFLQTRYAEFDGSFSPDGRWIAYTSQESGRSEVYVVPFPGPGGKRQVSTAGGGSARWRRDGSELFYIDADDRLIAVAVDGRGEGFEIGGAKPLFVIRRGGDRWVYDVSPDGQRILVNAAEDQTSAPITVVANWQSALRAREGQ
jgi:serine/threonine protein kinase